MRLTPPSISLPPPSPVPSLALHPPIELELELAKIKLSTTLAEVERNKASLELVKLGALNTASQIDMQRVSDQLKRVSFQLHALGERPLSAEAQFKVSGSNTDHGHSIYNSLASNGGIVTITSGVGRSVLSSELIAAASDLNLRELHESELVNLYTPSLIDVVAEVDSLLRLVNSEQYKWLRCVSGHRRSDMKPDLFSAYHPLVRYLPPYREAPSCFVPRVFGKFERWECRSSVHCIWDAKWKIDMEGFGEKCKYLQITGEDCVDHNGVAVKLKGVLFDTEDFWMIRSSGSTIFSLAKCPWRQEGSRQHLIDFLRNVDPWLEATAALCEQLHETVVDFSGKVSGLACLGSGANGRVFLLESGRVLKIVVGKRSDAVEREFILMQRYHTNDETSLVVFPVVEGSYRNGVAKDVSYAGYMLASKGDQMVLPLNAELKGELAIALFRLHAHGLTHGDPRVENALLLDGIVKWIDFRELDAVTTKIDMRRDVCILLQSLGGVLTGVEDLIEVYVSNPTADNLRNVVLCN